MVDALAFVPTPSTGTLPRSPVERRSRPLPVAWPAAVLGTGVPRARVDDYAMGTAMAAFGTFAFVGMRRRAAVRGTNRTALGAKARRLLYRENGRNAILRGIDKLADTVAVTMGPRGRNVLLDKGEFSVPQIVNDGVTIAREIELEDPAENTGAQLIRQAASKTNDMAGDGTTTATVLAQAMVHRGMRQLAGGANPVQLRNGMEKAATFVVSKIAELASGISDQDLERIKQIASIAAGGDEEAGQMIADAMKKVGGSGVVSLEESQSMETRVDVSEGMSIDAGYVSPYLSIDASNPERNRWEAKNPLVLVTDLKITMAQQDLIPILAVAKQAGRPLLLIADSVEKEALATLIINKLRGVVDCCAIQAPGFGDNRRATLQDIALVTGATFLTGDLDYKLDAVVLADFGGAYRVTVSKDSTTIVADAPKEKLEARCLQLRAEIKDAKSEYAKEQLEKRLAKLLGGVALIKVGAATETEMKDKKLRMEDAINATRAAVAEGVVPGGGAALCHLSRDLREWAATNLEADELRGAHIVADAMVTPLVTIARNAGLNGELVAEKVLEEPRFDYGYDARLQRYGNMTEQGIIDPAKVTRSALQHATSIASMILTTECVVVDAPEKHALRSGRADRGMDEEFID